MRATANILKTDAVVLRVAPFSETSHVVTWLTPSHGRLSTVIKGASRPRSPFLGQYDLFYTCELLFYERERNGLHIARECTPLDLRPRLRDDWRASCCASYLCDIVSRITGPGHHGSELYDLLTASLTFLSSHGGRAPFLFWFDLQLASELGFSPQITKCPLCSLPLPDSLPTPLFSSPHGGILCHGCGQDHQHGSISVTPDVFAMLRNWQSATSPRVAFNTRCSVQQLLAFRDLLGMFLQYHLDLPLHSRRIALDAVMNGQHNWGRSS